MWIRRTLNGLLAAALVTALGSFFAPATARADTGPPAYFDIGGGETPPEVATFDEVLDASAEESLVAINDRLDAHLYLDDAGMVRLGEVSAAELGVSERFLADYRAALEFSGDLIERGEIVVDGDLTVHTTDAFPAAETDLPDLAEAAPSGAVPDWNVWGYGSGTMFYTSFNTWARYRYNYYGWSNSLAARLGRPWLSRSFVYFYGYNRSYLNRYIYNPGGTYYFLPYGRSSACGYGYAPCYGSLGYKTGYFWVRSYNSYTRGYSWGWRGYWLRY